MKRIALFLFLIFSAIACFAQTQIDPTYQIQWNALAYPGAPAANGITCTQNGNYTVYPYGAEWGQSYQDTTNNVEYKCTTSGWVKNLPTTGGTLTGALNGTSASFSGTVAAGAVIPAEPTNTQGLWTRYGTVINGTSASGYVAQEPMVLPDGAGGVDMWLTCGWGVGGVCYSHSTDGLTFSAWTVIPALSGYEHGFVVLVGSTYYYYGANFAGGSLSFSRFHSTDKLTWVLDATGILPVNGTGWEQQYVGNIDVWTSATAPCVVGGTSHTWCALHEAQSTAGQWSIGLAYSNDGLAWTEYSGLATPTGTPTGTPSVSGGTVAIGTYYAKIVAIDSAGKGTLPGAESAVVTTTTSSSTISWAWAVVPNATSYQIYVGTSSGGETYFFTSSTNAYTQTLPYSSGSFSYLPTSASSGNPIINIGGGSAGGPEMHYANSRYGLWFHMATISSIPTDITFGYSSDLVNWNIGGSAYGAAAGLDRQTVDEGLFTTQGQTADPTLIDLNGQAHLYYSATDTQSPTSTDGMHIKVAISPLSIANLAQTQTNGATWTGWKGNVTGVGNQVLQNAPALLSPTLLNPTVTNFLRVVQSPSLQAAMQIYALSTADTVFSQQGGTGGNTQLFSIRTNGNAGVFLNTQNSAYMSLGVSAGSIPGSTIGLLNLLHDGYVGIGRYTQLNGSLLNVNGHISADALYGSDVSLTADLSCSSGGYWLAPIAGSTNNWRMCSNGTLSTLGSGGGGSYLPLSGGTLTGALNGTSASFSGTLAAGAVSQAADANASSSPYQDATINNVRQLDRSIKEWGAKCDGVTDDTIAMQAAINAVQGTGNALLIPAGANCYTDSGNLSVTNDIVIHSPSPTSNWANSSNSSVITWGNPANDGIVSSANVLRVDGITFIQVPAIAGTVVSATINSVTLSTLTNVHLSTYTATAITNGAVVYGNGVYTAGGKLYRVVAPLSPHTVASGDIPSFAGTAPAIGVAGTTQAVGGVTWEYFGSGSTYPLGEYSNGDVFLFLGTSGNTLIEMVPASYVDTNTPASVMLAGSKGYLISQGFNANASNGGTNQAAAIHMVSGNSPTITHNWFNAIPGTAVRMDAGVQGAFIRENTFDTTYNGVAGSLQYANSANNQYFNCFGACVTNVIGSSQFSIKNFSSVGDMMQNFGTKGKGIGFNFVNTAYTPIGTDSLVEWCTISALNASGTYNTFVFTGMKGCDVSANLSRNSGTALTLTNSDNNNFHDILIAGQESGVAAPYIALSGTTQNKFRNIDTFIVNGAQVVNYDVTGAALTDFTNNYWYADTLDPNYTTNNQGFVFGSLQNIASGSTVGLPVVGLSETLTAPVAKSSIAGNVIMQILQSNDTVNPFQLVATMVPSATAGSRGWTLQSVESGVLNRFLALNPNGGDILIGTLTDCSNILCVQGNEIVSGYEKATNFIETTQAAVSGTDCLQIDTGGYIVNSGLPCAVPTHTGTTGTITGTALTATCDSGPAVVTGAIVGHPVAVSSTTGADVGGAFNVRGSVTSTGTVTVYVCGTGTPASLAYNVTVF